MQGHMRHSFLEFCGILCSVERYLPVRSCVQHEAVGRRLHTKSKVNLINLSLLVGGGNRAESNPPRLRGFRGNGVPAGVGEGVLRAGRYAGGGQAGWGPASLTVCP